MNASRRDVVAGLALLGVAGAAQAITPRRRVTLLAGGKLETMVPRTLPGWAEASDVAVITPPAQNSLADRLYSQQVQRLYRGREGELIMMLIAYGDTQSDELQLHRPETCYPAVGFQVSRTVTGELPLGGMRAVPVRELSATLDQRAEQILYWTRLGEDLPTSNAEQRLVRLRTALRGIVPDGVLVRVSTLATDAAAGSATNRRFAQALIGAASPQLRQALLGRAFAQLGHG